MTYTDLQAQELLFSAIKIVQEHSGLGQEWLESKLPAVAKGWRPVEYLYQPDDSLRTRIAEYNLWCQTKKGEDAGHLMEEIALLAFRCLKGLSSVKSYQSYAAQIDLAVSGLDSDWFTLIQLLEIEWEHRTIVIEAKNESEPVNDHQFMRLCGILENVFTQSSRLGVFFSRLGASGFPERVDRSKKKVRLRSLEDAQATQVIFHARTKKYVVVLDHHDIQELVNPGSLPRILEAKIRAVEEWTGFPVAFNEELQEIDLPSHLSKHMK